MLAYPKYALVLLCTILFGITSCSVKTTVSKKEISDIDKMDFTLQQFMQKWKLLGGNIAVVKDDKLVYTKAFGFNLDHSRLRTFTPLKIASLSKPITSIAILKLVEEDKLKLEDKVFGPHGILNDALFSHIVDERMYDITIKNLLQHTAGWDRDRSPEGDPMFNPFGISTIMGIEGPADANTVIAYMLTRRLDFDPGSKYAYSNVGYNILGRVIEKISGYSYEDYVKENVFRPLDMGHMVLAKNDEYPDNNSVNNSNFINIQAMDAHGGWKATATDLAKLLVAVDPNVVTPFLKQEMLHTMYQSSEVNPYYACGWFVNELGNSWHTGSLKDCSAFMARSSSGVCVVAIFNSRPTDPNYFADMQTVIWESINAIQTWPSFDLFQNPTL